MLTGTPLDLTPFGSVMSGIGLLYWLLAGAGLWWALRGQRPWHWRLLRALPVILLFGYFPARTAWESYQWQQRSRAAFAHFETRCKSAGETITRTQENVDGVVWMKWRDKTLVTDQFDQFKLFDPYGKDCEQEGCILNLLRATKGLEHDPRRKLPHHVGYQFVESIDPNDGQTYRYSLRLYRPHERDAKWLETLIRPEIVKERIEKPTARYGIRWDDVSTREDREHWVAGGSLRVIDLQIQETIAEHVGFVVDRGHGSTAGFRSPWGAAPETACPAFPRAAGGGAFRSNRHDRFIFQVLKPSEKE